MSRPPYPSSPPSLPSPPRSRPLSTANGYSPKPYAPMPGANTPASKPLAHIEDLKAHAVKRLSVNHSLNHLVAEAQQSLNSADTLLQFRRPDLAYQDYLRAFEIVANIIPKHPDHPSLTGRRGPAQQTHSELLKRISASADQYESIKNIIINDNKRNGTQPAAATAAIQSRSQPTQPYDPPNRYPQPVPSPGQDARQPHASQDRSAPGAEALNERFARLRMLPTSDAAARLRRPESRASVASNGSTSSFHDQTPLSSFEALTPSTSNNSLSNHTAKPGGPRAMPNGTLHPLDTGFAAAMPKAPSPIYSPARNMQISGNINLPRTSARSIVGTGGRSNSAMSSASSHAPGNEGDDSAAYFPRVSLDGPPAAPPRRKSVHSQKEIRIGPEKLYDYLKMHNILLIDVRNRPDFDDGHIFTQSIINIDPTSLRRDMSAEDLQDSLVLSPEHEQAAFLDRNKFDLVVYYDQATSSDRFLVRPSTDSEFKLRYLYDALYEYNQEKPLQRPPILLMGGIEAWTELVGDQALETSNTAARTKPARLIRRVPVASSSSRLNIPKRRREYNPLDAEEERKWLERARVESVVVDQKSSLDGDSESRQDDDASPFFETIDEFNRRFPDAGQLEQRNMMGSSTSELFLPPQPRVPSYPAPPQSSVFAPVAPPKLPAVPSRPAPAMPRMSYSGVSDRVPSQSAQTTGSSDLPAYVSPRFQPSNMRLPRTGLVNFGVTCYMNATIQALSATIPLTSFFLDDRFMQLVQRDNWKGSKGLSPGLFANMIRSLWKGDVDAVRPTTLRSFCARLNREWGIERQQDAKEFLDFLVDLLHEDLNSNWSRTPLKALNEQQEEIRERMPKSIVSKTEWDRYTHREKSPLTSLFGGQHASRLRCTTCHFTSTTYEPFTSISVEIPKSGRATIQECLKSYCAEEMLSGDEVWKCPRCKTEREATKQITITRAPQIFVVHFKRFSAGRGQSTRKITTPIDFPLRNLNLEPYMLPSPTSTEIQEMSKKFPAEQLKPEPSMSPPYLYDAYSVMRHIGTNLTSGHYICLAKDNGRNCWREFNDTRVRDFNPDNLPDRDRLQNEMAYIVFYQRVSDK